MSASESGPEASPSASAWPTVTMYPTASGTPTQSPFPTLEPSQKITVSGSISDSVRSSSTTLRSSISFFSIVIIDQGRKPGAITLTGPPSATFSPSNTFYPTASGTPTTSPFPTNDGSTTVYPTASGTPTTSPFPTFEGTSSPYPTASGTPTVSPYPSTFYPTASGTPTVSPFPSDAVSQAGLPALRSKYSYEKTCSEFVEGPGQVDTELVFTYLAESRGTSLTFLTELEKQLLDHASAALACTNNSTLNIYRLAFPADESASDATTCERVHKDSESCWVLQTRILVTSDRGSASLAKNTVLVDLREQLDDEVLLTKSFKDLTFTEYLGPDPVDSTGMPIGLTPQASNAGSSNETLKYSAMVAVGLAVVTLLGFFGMLYHVRRKRNSVLLRNFDRGNKSTTEDVEVAELLSRSKKRLKDHPLTAGGGDSFEDKGVVHQNGDVEPFNDEHEFYEDTLFREEEEARGKSNSSPRALEYSRGSSNEASKRDERAYSSQRHQSQRSLSSATSSKNQQPRPSSSSTREGVTRTSSQRSVSQRQREDPTRRTSSSRSEATPRKGEVSRSSSRPSDSRRDQPSRASSKGRHDEATRRSPQRNIPQSVEIDLLDAPDDFSEINETFHSSSRRPSAKEQSTPTSSSSTSRRSGSDARDGTRRLSQGSSRPSSERVEGSYRSSSDRGPSGRGGERRSTSESGEDPARRSTSTRKAPSSSLYDDPVELAKERMAVAKADAEERRSRRMQSSSRNDGSAKFDNVEIV
jgi:hypothetical protein